jgi:hypothetical protein
METANIVRDIASLPPEAQKEVTDFVAFLMGAQRMNESLYP